MRERERYSSMRWHRRTEVGWRNQHDRHLDRRHLLCKWRPDRPVDPYGHPAVMLGTRPDRDGAGESAISRCPDNRSRVHSNRGRSCLSRNLCRHPVYRLRQVGNRELTPGVASTWLTVVATQELASVKGICTKSGDEAAILNLGQFRSSFSSLQAAFS